MSSMNSVSTLTSLSAKTGMGGLVSGMDIDELVFNLTASSRNKIVKQKQTIQKLQWKQTAYRSTAKALKDFQAKYLDVLSATNFRSAGYFNTVRATSSSSAVSATATASAAEGVITIDSVLQLATKQTAQSATPVTKPLSGSLSSSDMGLFLEDITGQTLGLQLDGTLKTITFDNAFIDSLGMEPTQTDFGVAFQAAIDQAFGVKSADDRVITASVNEGVLSLTATGSQLTVRAIGGDEEILADLGLASDQSNALSSSKSIESLGLATPLDALDTFQFTINEVAFEFNKTDSLSTVISRINSSNANVTISYSSVSDKFSMTANSQGSGENIQISDTEGNLMTALGLTAESGAVGEYGKNAILFYNGTKITRSSNRFQIDGIDFELKNTTAVGADPVTVTMEADADVLIEPIKQFVQDYNTMIDRINSMVKEKVYSDYAPLTDEQREEMTEAQIASWEEKAKSGLLRGDRALSGIANKLYSAMILPIAEAGISLNEMGITSAGYTENGKLKIDETKLKKALLEKPMEIRDLFSSERGIASKINTVITDAVKSAGPKGTRGTLIEIAGIDLTTSDTENNITDTITLANKAIDTLNTRLTKEESRLWKQFTTMETVLQQLNSQSSIISQFYSGSAQ